MCAALALEPGRVAASFWMADYPEAQFDFAPMARAFRAQARRGARMSLVDLTPVMRAVVCSGISAYRSGDVALYLRSKQAAGHDNGLTTAVVEYLAVVGFLDHAKGLWQGVGSDQNRASCFRGTAALAKALPGIRIGPRFYLPPEFLVELRSDTGEVLKGFKTAAGYKAKAVAAVNRALKKASITVGDERTNGIQIHRVFNRDWQHGGRIYHPAQTMPKTMRSSIKINGEATVELDFSGLHIALAYAKSGLPPPCGDVYEIKGFRRDLIKVASLITLNGGGAWAIRERLESLNGERISHASASSMRDAFLEKHAPIKSMLGDDNIGLSLQFMDSEIAERVLLEMLARDIVVLPWHDSFVVDKRHSLLLEDVMRCAYRDIVGFDAPEIRMK